MSQEIPGPRPESEMQSDMPDQQSAASVINRTPERRDRRQGEVVGLFQERFPHYSHADFSDPNNLIIFTDSDRRKKVQYISVYPSLNGFNVRVGNTNTDSCNSQSLPVATVMPRRSEVQVPVIQPDPLRPSRQVWGFDAAEDAVYIAEKVIDGVVIDDEILDQIVSVKSGGEPDALEYQTFKDLLLDQMRLDMIRNERLRERIGPIDSDRTREIRVRRLLQLSQAEQKSVALQRLRQAAERGSLPLPFEEAVTAVEEETPQGQKMLKQQVLEVEGNLAMVQMDKFVLPNEKKN